MRKSLLCLFVLSALCCAQINAAENMLLNWKFDSSYGFGAFEYDASGNNNDGVVVWNRVGYYGGLSWKPEGGFIGGAGCLAKGVRGNGFFAEHQAIGCRNQPTAFDEYRLYDRVLTAEEIKRIYEMEIK